MFRNLRLDFILVIFNSDLFSLTSRAISIPASPVIFAPSSLAISIPASLVIYDLSSQLILVSSFRIRVSMEVPN
jgi:hypothetical protein